VSAERVFGLLDTEPTITSPPPRAEPSAGAGATPAPARGGVSATSGSPTRAEQWVLRDCSFRLAPGEDVALVGPTGEGKTTIARLLIPRTTT